MQRRHAATLLWPAIGGLYVLYGLALLTSWMLGQPRSAALWCAARLRFVIRKLEA